MQKEIKGESQHLEDGVTDDGDFNAACSVLYRWWGILEATPQTDISKHFDGLFDEAVEVELPDAGLALTGPASVEAMIPQIHSETQRCHVLDDSDVSLTYLGNSVYRLEVDFTYQIKTDSGVITRHCRGDNTLRKLGPAHMIFTRISSVLGNEIEGDPFQSSYRINRAKAVLIQWQAHMDTLSGDASGLQELVMAELEFHGLISSKQDASAAQEEVVTDFTEMKGLLAGTNGSEDTVIRGFSGLGEWFATGPSLLTSNIHRCETIQVVALNDSRFAVQAQFGWWAVTLSGVDIELHQPLDWVMVEQNEKYMRLEKLSPAPDS